MNALLTLEDGYTLTCKSFTGNGKASGEIVFNTSMTGYQEIITDPSYSGQIITMTYPMIGNYGTNFNDIESKSIHINALLMKEYQPNPSNYRTKISLDNYLKKHNIFGADNLDTRALTRHIRKFGTMRAFISTKNSNYSKTKKIINPVELGLVNKVSTKTTYRWTKTGPEFIPTNITLNNNIWKQKNIQPSIIIPDYGVKLNILRCLEDDFEIIVVPIHTSARKIITTIPDGIILPNGPGNPLTINFAINTVKKLLLEKIPIFGICLGHQILGLALGGKTYKLKFGHRSSNQPVKNLATNRVEITSQNHGFAIDPDSLNKNNIEITHINLNDYTIEGIKHKKLPAFSVQYHPEASPGPHDSIYLFKEFKELIYNR